MSKFVFTIKAKEGEARTGVLNTPHGNIVTPVFMPVGTHGAVKAVSPDELVKAGSQIILANTYHLYLRPGDQLIHKLGGLHSFMNWPRPLLTDSGGFQVFSLGERGMAGGVKEPLRQVGEEGIVFQSHLDGSRHLFTPEKSIQIQQNLGADIIMAFDQPVYGLSKYSEIEGAMQRSKRWLERSFQEFRRLHIKDQALFGIVQGGVHAGLHRESAEHLASLNLPGNAIGGLSVGEAKEEMWEAVSSINRILPKEKPRYFMGLGEPYDVIEAVWRGVDMFDCVAPSRLARHGTVWMVEGEERAVEAFYSGSFQELLKISPNRQLIKFVRINLHNRKFQDDKKKLLFSKNNAFPDLSGFTLATLRHYLNEGEMLGYRILTLHNIELLNLICSQMRQALAIGGFSKLREIIK